MTATAYALNLGMVYRTRLQRRPAGGKFLVAGITGIGGWHMGGGFTTGGSAVMAGDAIIDETTVVHTQRRHPGIGLVTGIARRTGDDMVGRFSSGDGAVVAASTGAGDLRMVYRRRSHRFPGGEILMTSGTHIAGGDVAGGFVCRPHPRGMTQHAVINDRQ